ncbi:MAG: VacB/RNase II family 3'-5' exoribonuclease [Hyphomicrobiaceae bacterium]|nr:VacB/RNase II family 3'-5' exoribonuclease [Hyphomicrobiaceae bacterium]
MGIFYSDCKGGGFITSVHRKQKKSWHVTADNEVNAGDGDLVLFQPSLKNNFDTQKARIVEVLADLNDKRQIGMIAVHSYGLANKFPKHVLDELSSLPSPLQNGRVDLRDLSFVTIDPEDARDYDDAVHAIPDEDPSNKGGWIVTVAVADVAYYVRYGTALDREAYRRSNSVYFPDLVLPMLPHMISNNLCSLIEAEDRPCLAVRMVFDKYGIKRQHSIYRALIRSAINLTYEKAQQTIDENAIERCENHPGSVNVLVTLWHAYNALKNSRQRRNPLELNLRERRIRLDENGQVYKFAVPTRLSAHGLIEEFMIQANVAAAETLEKSTIPFIYRTHDQPSKDKLRSCREILNFLGLKFTAQGTIHTKIFNRILLDAQTTPVAEIINEAVLRAQAQAMYSSQNCGHFGLNLKCYTHFTSPIRRYSDLIVHRAIIRALNLGSDGLTDAECSQLPIIAAHISQMERRSVIAERETVSRLIAEHFSKCVGEEFHAQVSGFINSGLFVKLCDTGADGFIPVSSLHDDHYYYDLSQYAMIGKRKSLRYELGDNVRVRLVETLLTHGTLRFKMLSVGKKKRLSIIKSTRQRNYRYKKSSGL